MPTLRVMMRTLLLARGRRHNGVHDLLDLGRLGLHIGVRVRAQQQRRLERRQDGRRTLRVDCNAARQGARQIHVSHQNSLGSAGVADLENSAALGKLEPFALHFGLRVGK